MRNVHLHQHILNGTGFSGAHVYGFGQRRRVYRMDEGDASGDLIYLVFLQPPYKMQRNSLIGALRVLLQQFLHAVFAYGVHPGGNRLPYQPGRL
jgi:hypothetical protein